MKPGWNRRRWGALALALVAAAACSSPQGTEQADNSLLGKGKDKGSAAGKNGGGAKSGGGAKGGAKKPDGGTEGIPSAAPGVPAVTPGGSGKGIDPSSKTKTEVASQGTDPRTANVIVTEPDPDAEKSGIAPDFADILSTQVEGAGPNVRITLTFRADLPDKMPDDQTYMVAGIGMTPPKGRSQGYAFGASADMNGWTPYGAGKDGKSYPGEFSLSGDTVVFTIPWAAIEGPRSFEWYAQTSWFKSVAGTTHYSLDALPNDGPAKYPAG